MFDKPQATHTLGLDIDGNSLKGVALSFVAGQPKLDETFELAVADHIAAETSDQLDTNVKPLYIEGSSDRLEELTKNHLVVTALDSQETLVRPLQVKIKKEKDIDAILSFQSEPILPYPVENAVIDKIILSKEKDGYRLSILAARKDHLDNHIKRWNSIEIEPEDISATPAALALFTKQFAGAEGMIYALHIGRNSSLCILVDCGKLIAAQGIKKGVETFIQTLMKDKESDLARAKELLSFNPDFLKECPDLNQSVESFRLEVTRTIFSLAKQAKEETVGSIFLTGEGASIEGIADILCLPLNKTSIPPLSLPNFPIEESELLRFALPIGLALSALPKCREQINFRQREFAFPSPWKRLKKPLAIYLALCFGIAVALVLFGKSYLSYRQADLKSQYLNLLQVMKKPYSSFEKEFNAKFPKEVELQKDGIIPIEMLTQEEMISRLNFLEKELQGVPRFYPLRPNVPTVSDVLAWISTHPNVVGKSEDEKNDSSLQIENFNYAMIKRPELSRTREKYQVKVEFEFTSPTPKMAREFHDALIMPNEIVDPKGEIKWSSNRDKYRTSFYLKDKTIYTN